jgi:eukaryotic-like serine/threonine-protein kinase
MSLATRNIEPIQGYILREKIGAGGYGEVWKADAPGGLAKAIKLVYGYADGDRASRESKALDLIKSLRHPFLLSLERIEIVDGQLVIVTELADCSLKDRFELRRSEGSRGIPRAELLRLMRDAADALDYMNDQFSLQHLDVKPENLLLVGDHIKVADFGLVKDVQKQTASMLGGLTPVYASPELFNGAASRRSDQYSLAIVYQEMLTGVLPFPGKTAAQLAAQHLNAKPLLHALPPNERCVVARALAKDPQQRFMSCREFVDYLQSETLQATLPPPEHWFRSEGPPPEVENVSSTLCLSAQTNPPVAAPKSQQTEAMLSYDYDTTPSATSETPSIESCYDDRSADDMFADLDEASESLHAAVNATYVMRKSREPQINHLDAEMPSPPATIRPTVIVGIGRIAGLVMQRLKQRMVDRLGKAEAVPAVQFLLLDADSQDIQSAARGDDGAALDPSEVMLLGLRKSQEYRNESPGLLRWLSRRWLYNIPRSQTPEGLRPLGRLAFVDHARSVRDRLKKAIQRASSPQSLQATAAAAKLPCLPAPRVIVLGAICGGTAGGMLLDVCYLARQLLGKLGQEDRDVLGLMLHYRGRQPASHELATVNTYATLAELDYYARPEKGFPGDPSCGLEAKKGSDHAPMREAYFVHLGDFLTDAAVAQSADRVAEYLYLDSLTSVGNALVACRSASRVEGARGIPLRSFGVSQAGFSSGEMVPWTAMSLCREMFHRWLGQGQEERAEVEAAAAEEAKALVHGRQLTLSALMPLFLSELERRLPEKPERWFGALLAGDKPLDAPTLARLDINAVIGLINELFGVWAEDGLGPTEKYPATLQSLVTYTQDVAKKLAAEFAQAIVERLQAPGLRMCGAEKAAKVIVEQLTQVYEAAGEQRREFIAPLTKLESLLGIGEQAPGVRVSTVRKSPAEFTQRFSEYAQLRMINVAVFFVQQLLQRTKNALVPVLDQLSDARREIKGLLDQMDPGELDSSDAHDLESQLRDTLMAEFSQQRATLVKVLDTWLDESHMKPAGGFIPCIIKGGEHRLQLVNELFHASRALLMQSLRGLNVATFLLEPCFGAEGHRLLKSVEAAQPKPLADASCRTLVALSENFADEASRTNIAQLVRERNSAAPSVIGYRESDVAIVCELSGMSAAEVAIRLIDERGDFIEYARRVFSRSDISFEPLVMQNDE